MPADEAFVSCTPPVVWLSPASRTCRPLRASHTFYCQTLWDSGQGRWIGEIGPSSSWDSEGKVPSPVPAHRCLAKMRWTDRLHLVILLREVRRPSTERGMGIFTSFPS